MTRLVLLLAAAALVDIVYGFGFVRMKTGIEKSYRQLQIEPRGTSIVFRVQAKNDAHIGLFKDSNIYTDDHYEIVIGGWANTRSVLRNEGQVRDSKETKGVLDQASLRAFGVQWPNGSIELGSGNGVGMDRLLYWVDPYPRDVAIISISTGYRSDGIWEFSQEAIGRTVINTPAWGTSDLAWFTSSANKVFIFNIMACEGAHLALSQELGSIQTLTYEVIIGGDNNTKAVIRSTEDSVSTIQSVSDLLKCEESRPFWILFDLGRIQVGRGRSLGEDRFIHHTFENPHEVKGVGIWTFSRMPGKWEFLDPTECPNGRWGIGCARCSFACEDTCDKVNGSCQCIDGWYGTRCEHRCSDKCVTPTSCDKILGHCSCKPGFQPPTCVKVCENGRFGRDCNATCSDGCWNGTCDNVDGTCRCLDSHYLDNCTGVCGSGCSLLPCDRLTGECSCEIGFQPPMCHKICEKGKFGQDCGQKCSDGCRNGHCNNTDGTCQCFDSHYLRNCTEICGNGCSSIPCDRLTGECSCEIGWQPPKCESVYQSSASALVTGLGVGIPVILLLIAAVASILLFMRRRSKKGPNGRNKPISFGLLFSKTNHGRENPNRRRKNSALEQDVCSGIESPAYEDEHTSLSTRTCVADFPGHVMEMKQSVKGFQEEYESLPAGLCSPCVIGSMPEASFKNRFKNIIAYDHSRVHIEGETPLSQYVNANFINGFRSPKAFIAAQGPVKETVADFIQMVWEQNIPLIIMVTNLVENNKAKCYQYWPSKIASEPMVYNGIIVTKQMEQTFSHYVVRKLQLEKDGATHSILHLQYISWPDHGVPESPAAFLDFHQRAKRSFNPEVGPTLVHCSAGVGRTGTFLVVDYLLEQAKQEGHINVYECVKRMRKDRVNMVQSLDQYVFIHESVLEALHCGKTVYDVASFDGFISSDNKKSLVKQYKMLEKITPPANTPNDAEKEENYHKNRSLDVVPSANWRPILMTPASGSNDYINAVFVHGYQKKHAYIATQSPLLSTVVDLWRMVLDYECNTIIALNDTGNEEACPNYWSEMEDQIGPFSVCVWTETEHNGYIRRELQLKYKREEKKVKQFQVKGWIPGTLPAAVTLLSLFEEVKGWQQESEDNRIIVHCLNGASETGLYLGLCHVCDKIEREQEVDVFHAVQTIRKSQPLFIMNQEQYAWLHQAAHEYISSFSMYANFK